MSNSYFDPNQMQKIVLPMIKKMFPSVIAQELLSVQPMMDSESVFDFPVNVSEEIVVQEIDEERPDLDYFIEKVFGQKIKSEESEEKVKIKSFQCQSQGYGIISVEEQVEKLPVFMDLFNDIFKI